METIFIERIHHHKAKELSMDITFGDSIYCGDHGSCDGFETIEEARKQVLDILQSMYDGSYYADLAEDREYARQERFATGNY